MLHILWAIIKFILILAGILIGLVLAAILLVLFCPVRYRICGSKDRGDWKNARGAARVNWLLGLVSFRISYQDGKESHSLKIAGIPLFGKKKKRRKKKKVSRPKESSVQQIAESEKIRGKETKMLSSAEDTLESRSIESEVVWTDTATVPDHTDTAVDLGKAKTVPAKKHEKPEPIQKPESSQRPGLFFRIREKIKKVIQGIKAFFKKLKNIRKAFADILEKIKWWKVFLRSEEMKEALCLVKEQCTGLLKHIFPTRIKGKTAFGCEDPAVTGMVLAVLGMSIPLHKNCIQVSPAFDSEENFLEGEVSMKGRIYGIVLLRTGIRIYFNKNIKYILNQWKHKEDLNYGK